MSRCFPFPPPGYHKTLRPDGQLASHLLGAGDKVQTLPNPNPPTPTTSLLILIAHLAPLFGALWLLPVSRERAPWHYVCSAISLVAKFWDRIFHSSHTGRLGVAAWCQGGILLPQVQPTAGVRSDAVILAA
jgi:hypothetical protein